MDVQDLKGLAAEVKKRMDGAIEHVRKELSGVRTSRASVTVLDPVHVEAYGAMMPMNQVAQLSIPEPSLIGAQPFDPTLLGAIEKAIQKSNLGLNPAVQGKIIRIIMPELSEERRQEFVRVVRKMAEDGRVAIRHVRGDGMEAVKGESKAGGVSEEDVEHAEKEIQKLTDDYIKKIGGSLKSAI